MYVSGFFAVALFLVGLLMVLSVVPLTHVGVGGLFILVAIGFAAPFVVTRSP